MSVKVYVVGVGPGGGDYVTLRVVEALRSATIVAGFSHSLSAVESIIRGKRVFTLNLRAQEATLAEIAAEATEADVVVFTCTGDPMFSDSEFVARIVRRFGEVEIIPGVSSIQVAAARLHLSLDKSVVLTFHAPGELQVEKRRLLEAALRGETVVLLPRPWDFMPQHIAQFLIEGGVSPEAKAAILENLTLPSEKIFKGNLAEVAEREFGDLSVMVIGV